MSRFIDVSKYFNRYKILILGSYHPNNIQALLDLKGWLIERGFTRTYLARDIIKEEFDYDNKDILANFYSKIESEMINSDFNIFIFFREPNRENESTIVELSSLVHSEQFSKKIDKTLVLFPSNFSSSMLEGFVTSNKLNIFIYEDEIYIFPKCFAFIKQNIVEYIK